MQIIAERIIAYLKSDSTLTGYLGSADNIMIMGLTQRPKKRVLVSTDVGQDGNNVPIQYGDMEIQIVVSRNVEDAPSECIKIAQRVGDLLNQSELSLTSGSWQILNFILRPSPGLQIDGKDNEYWFPLMFDFMLGKSV